MRTNDGQVRVYKVGKGGDLRVSCDKAIGNPGARCRALPRLKSMELKKGRGESKKEREAGVRCRVLARPKPRLKPMDLKKGCGERRKSSESAVSGAVKAVAGGGRRSQTCRQVREKEGHFVKSRGRDSGKTKVSVRRYRD